MIFRQSLRRDLNSVAGVMFATLFTILVTTSLIRFLNRATSDRIASSDILPLIAFNAIGFIPVLLVHSDTLKFARLILFNFYSKILNVIHLFLIHKN